jgi:hypothetical protein
LVITGRGFAAGEEVTLQCRDVAGLVVSVRADRTGQLQATLALPPALPHGTFTLDARAGARLLTSSDFSKPHGDEGPRR